MKANIASIKRFAVHDGELSAPVDAAIVATNMLLEVHNIDAGACWVMHFDPNAMREKFNIPSNIKPIALLVMGYPAEDAKPLNLQRMPHRWNFTKNTDRLMKLFFMTVF